jgi:hypothetical protein
VNLFINNLFRPEIAFPTFEHAELVPVATIPRSAALRPSRFAGNDPHFDAQ